MAKLIKMKGKIQKFLMSLENYFMRWSHEILFIICVNPTHIDPTYCEKEISREIHSP